MVARQSLGKDVDLLMSLKSGVLPETVLNAAVTAVDEDNVLEKTASERLKRLQMVTRAAFKFGGKKAAGAGGTLSLPCHCLQMVCLRQRGVARQLWCFGGAGAELQQESEPPGAEGLQSARSMSYHDMQRGRSIEGDGDDAVSEHSAQRGPSPANSLGQRDWMDKIVDGPRVKFQTKADRLRRRSILAPGGHIASLARL